MGMDMGKDKIKGKRMAWHAAIFCGTVISIWSVAALLSGLAQVNWQVSELLRQYLITIGLMQEFHTLSDFYTHIKGVEYIIAVLFLGAFPAFYTYLNRTKGGIAVKT
jgi:branched-subunit amino acid ABC-type transport system permease component